MPRWPIAYLVDQEPIRSTPMLRGTLTVEGDSISITGPRAVRFQANELRGVTFKREPFLTLIILDGQPRVFLTPVLFSLNSRTNFVSETRHTNVYSALRQLIRGPGHCAKCGYDLRESALPCPECGSTSVRPIEAETKRRRPSRYFWVPFSFTCILWLVLCRVPFLGSELRLLRAWREMNAPLSGWFLNQLVTSNPHLLTAMTLVASANALIYGCIMGLLCEFWFFSFRVPKQRVK